MNDDASDKKWIHAKQIEPSPGLKACIRLAKTFYTAKIKNPQIIVGDELDRAVAPKRAQNAMDNLFKYCKSNKILLFVSAHTTEVQNMDCDIVLHFENGFVYK